MVTSTNLVVLEGDWNDGDILREIRFMNNEELEKFTKKFKEIGELYRRYKKEYDFRDYGEFMNWLEEYDGDDIKDPTGYFMFIEEYFPYEGHSQTGCRWVTLNAVEIMIDYENCKIEKI